MNPRGTRIVAIACLLVCAVTARAQSWTAIDVPTRSGVPQRFLHAAPSDAKAVVILFAGGDGGLKLGAGDKISTLRGNFLVRSRDRFVQQRFAVAIIAHIATQLAPA
ncbi:MAG: hypothetical protein ABIU95_00370 [Burkholderiales bacterium]